MPSAPVRLISAVKITSAAGCFIKKLAFPDRGHRTGEKREEWVAHRFEIDPADVRSPDVMVGALIVLLVFAAWKTAIIKIDRQIASFIPEGR